MSKTFLMLKPDAFQNKDKILDVLTSHGIRIIKSQELDVDIHVMKTLLSHYHQVIDEKGPEFDFVGKMFNTFYFYGNKKIMPMIVEYDGPEDIIDYTRAIVGKTNPADAKEGTIRHEFSDDNYEKASIDNRLVHNVIHASDSHESAKREIQIWEDSFL